jgi:hypothetical protein
MSVRAAAENGLHAEDTPFEMAKVSALGMAETARRALATPAKARAGIE